MKKKEVKIIGLSYSQTQIGSYVCILDEVDGERRIPLILKPDDAQVIALSLEEMKSPRPKIHDLLKDVMELSGLDCLCVNIYKVMEGIFYAKIVISNGLEDTELESTSGDAISIAAKFGCPIFVNEEVLDIAGIILNDDNANNNTNIRKDENKKVNIEDLEIMIQDALEQENYEIAAEIRDKINKLKLD
jgi:uncharacterized protein